MKMLIDTTIIEIAGSHYVRIPKNVGDYFKVKAGKCKIEDLNKKEAKLVFGR